MKLSSFLICCYVSNSVLSVFKCRATIFNGRPVVSDLGVSIPGPQTVDLIPIVSRTGSLCMAPSRLLPNTSQSNSNKEKANSFGTYNKEYIYV